MAVATPIRTWTFAQWSLMIFAVVHTVWALVGFIAEPSFETGHDAPTAQILGMDYNGWHAVAGLLLFGPAVVFATRRSWAVLYLIVGGIAGGAPGVWALFSHQVAFVFTFPHNTTDAVEHFVTAAMMLSIAAIQIWRDGGLQATLADLRSSSPRLN